MAPIQAIDTMCRAFYARPELAKTLFEAREFEQVAATTFAGIRKRHGIEEGEEWRVFGILGAGSVEATLEEMDELGIETVFMDQLMQWSRHESRLLTLIGVDALAELADEADSRIVPGVGYNPHRIAESLERVERAVTELDFGYVWFHPTSFGMRPTDRRCYPLYAKAAELDVPVCYQTGQAAEPLPSEAGRPMYADEVAMEFPDLTLVLTHAGWPWPEEWVSMLWRHPNVYGNIGAYMPSFLPERQVEFIDSGRLRHKVMWATNGIGLERCLTEFNELALREETRERVLRENALEVFDL